MHVYEYFQNESDTATRVPESSYIEKTSWKIALNGAIIGHFTLTTGKHVQVIKENSKGMKDISASNYVMFR